MNLMLAFDPPQPPATCAFAACRFLACDRFQLAFSPRQRHRLVAGRGDRNKSGVNKNKEGIEPMRNRKRGKEKR